LTVSETAAWYFYLGTFLALLASGLGFPIPEEIPVVTAGVMAGREWSDPASHLRWWVLLPVCIVGVVTGDGFLYGMGRWFGPRVLENRWMRRMIPPEKRSRIEANFHQYGVLVLLFARFLPAIRSPIFITAGVMRLPFTRFVLADGLYALPGVSLLFFLSFWFGQSFADLVERAEERVDRLRPLLILLFIAAIAGFLLYHFLRRPVVTGEPEDLPMLVDKMAVKTLKIERPHELRPPSADGAPPANDKAPSETRERSDSS
jgi:membrane protein DedA with SNARE-associated domain